MEGERVIFVEEAGAGQYLKLVATGRLDDSLLEALEDFTKRQRKRLNLPNAKTLKSVDEDDKERPDDEDRDPRD